jgi:hypothetical protein
MTQKWKMITALGSWRKVSRCKAFRFYLREHKITGEQVYFADYRIDDLTSRFHEVGSIEDGTEANFRKANRLILDLTRESLAILENN